MGVEDWKKAFVISILCAKLDYISKVVSTVTCTLLIYFYDVALYNSSGASFLGYALLLKIAAPEHLYDPKCNFSPF